MRHEETTRQQALDKLKHEDTVRQHVLEEKKLLMEMLKCQAITRDEFRDKLEIIEQRYLPLFATESLQPPAVGGSRAAVATHPPPAVDSRSTPRTSVGEPAASTPPDLFDIDDPMDF